MKMENHIDITFDLETCSLSPNAAVMKIAAIAWDRDKKVKDKSPFFEEDDFKFQRSVDLRSCVTSGFDFSMETINWWAKQPEKAKYMLEKGEPEDIYTVFLDFFNWIDEVKKKNKARTVCLWCQGADFDLAILRNICIRLNMECPVEYTHFRDCRTFVTEFISLYDGLMDFTDYKKLYKEYIPDFPVKEICNEDVDVVPHDPLYDAMRSTWFVWRALCLNRFKAYNEE